MKQFIFALFVVLVAMTVRAQENIINQADQAYTNEDYPQALELYIDAMRLQGTSPQLYFNIGNTYYRLGDLGHAILYYKKALKLDPTFKDAQTNLEFTQTKVIDRQDNQKSWSRAVTESIIFIMTPNAWAVTGIIFFGLFLLALSQYFLGTTVGIRKLAFFGGLGALALTVLTTIAAFYTSGLTRDNKEAVVTVPVVQLSTVPRLPADKSQQAFTLHEGAIVEVLDTLSVPTDTVNPVWVEVKVNNEHRAWLSASTITRI